MNENQPDHGSSPPLHPMKRNIALRFDKVSFSYEKVKVFEEASFHIHQGEFVALTGPNGSGKTTALKLLLGLELPQSGVIELFGETSLRQRGRVGYVPQQAYLDRAFPISVREVVKMGRLNRLSRFFGAPDKIAVDQALEQAEITDLANRSYNALSGGQRRRVLVARALASLSDSKSKVAFPKTEVLEKPQLSGGNNGSGLLILDEPTANMDMESEDRLFATLGRLKGNTTILIVTHDRDFVSSLVDRVLCMDKDSHIASEAGHEFKVVQHPLQAADVPNRDDSRILHEESFPGDICYTSDDSGKDGAAKDSR
ncbi:MAG: metal ABC transporter ATP-binding protein [Treponema sp.]|nr:metal ABC transporter ATP-binding protein [Treponema sp.]